MGRCQFFASEAGYVHDAYQTEVRGAWVAWVASFR